MCEHFDQVFKMIKMFKILGTDLLSIWLSSLLLDEVSLLDETALVTAVSIPSNVRLETSRLGRMTTGPTKSEDHWGMKLPHRRDREFSRRARSGEDRTDLGRCGVSDLRVSS